MKTLSEIKSSVRIRVNDYIVTNPGAQGIAFVHGDILAEELFNGFSWSDSVISFYDTTNGLPEDPLIFDRYIFTETNGEYQADFVHEWDGIEWIQISRIEGQPIYVKSEKKFYFWDNENWTLMSGSGGVTDHRVLEYLNSINYWHLTAVEYEIFTGLPGLIKGKEAIGVAAALVAGHETEWDHSSFLTALPEHNHDHSLLTNINSQPYYHLTISEYSDLTDLGDTSLHYHASDRARANHTGLQAISTISGLQIALDGKQPLDADLTTIAGLSHVSGNMIMSNGTSWVSRKLQNSDLPAIAITDTYVVSSQSAMLALGSSGAERGDVAVRTDLNKSFILKGANPAILADWQELLSPTDAVLSVDGRHGVVSLSDLYCSTNDLRLSNARTPIEHATSHLNGGSDPIEGDQFFRIFKILPTDPWAVGHSYGGIGIGSNDGNNRQMILFTDGGNDQPIFGINRSTDGGTAWEQLISVAQSGKLKMHKLASSRTVETDANSYLVTAAKKTGYNLDLGSTSGTICSGDDLRLSDARTPLAHNHNRLVGNNYSSSGTQLPSDFGSGRLIYQMLSNAPGNGGSPWGWADILWISSYTGSDVKRSNAIIMSKDGDPFIGFRQQNYDSTAWGVLYTLYGSHNPTVSPTFNNLTLTGTLSMNGQLINDWVLLGSTQGGSPDYLTRWYKVYEVTGEARGYEDIEVRFHGDTNYYYGDCILRLQLCRYNGPVGNRLHVTVTPVSGYPQNGLVKVVGETVWVASSLKWGDIHARLVQSRHNPGRILFNTTYAEAEPLSGTRIDGTNCVKIYDADNDIVVYPSMNLIRQSGNEVRISFTSNEFLRFSTDNGYKRITCEEDFGSIAIGIGSLGQQLVVNEGSVETTCRTKISRLNRGEFTTITLTAEVTEINLSEGIYSAYSWFKFVNGRGSGLPVYVYFTGAQVGDELFVELIGGNYNSGPYLRYDWNTTEARWITTYLPKTLHLLCKEVGSYGSYFQVLNFE